MSDALAEVIPFAPIPTSHHDYLRCEHTRLRRRMMYGLWREDLIARLHKMIGFIRQDAWGEPDLSSNVLRASSVSLAVLYSVPATWVHDTASGTELEKRQLEEFSKTIRASGWTALMDRVERDTIALREMLLRAEITPNGDITYKPVYPDMVSAEADPNYPDQPVKIWEAVLRCDPESGKSIWTWDHFDISDPNNPIQCVLNDNKDIDLSDKFLKFDGEPAPKNGFRGENYKYRYSDAKKTPFIPYVIYHAAKTGMLFDPYELRELVEGSLNAAVLWTFFAHCARNASWPQRWTINLEIQGAEMVQGVGGPRLQVVTDPATVTPFKTLEDINGAPGQAGQWAQGSDPLDMQEAFSLYERRVAAYAGISPADVQRVSGDPRSGYAMAITREAQREAQRRFEPQFRESDERLLGMSAAMLNRAKGTSYPENGYRMVYGSLPPSVEERQATREDLLALVQNNLMDKIEAYKVLNPGISTLDAAKALDEIASVNARYRTAI